MTRNTTKAGRLALIMELQRAGLIGDEVSQADLARWLGVNRSTIHKDLAVIVQAQAVAAELLATQPWAVRYYSTSETAEALGLDYDTALAMIAGDVIHAERAGERGQWRVPVAEVDRWRRILDAKAPR